jgi:hypothetical protein
MNFSLYILSFPMFCKGVEGVVRGLEGTHLADRCILTKLE